mgnify:CR=1 FL=1
MTWKAYCESIRQVFSSSYVMVLQLALASSPCQLAQSAFVARNLFVGSDYEIEDLAEVSGFTGRFLLHSAYRDYGEIDSISIQRTAPLLLVVELEEFWLGSSLADSVEDFWPKL